MQTNSQTMSYIDQHAGLATAMHNHGLYGELLRRFLQNQAHFYEQFNGLREKQEDLLALHCVHSLKGLAGNIGAKLLEKSAAKLEYALQHNTNEEVIKILLKETNEVLTFVLSEIKTIEENFPKQPCIKGSMDVSSVKRLWKRLEEELKNYDANATDTMEILLKQPSSQIPHEEVTLLSDAIANYQFEEALEHLHRINTSSTKH